METTEINKSNQLAKVVSESGLETTTAQMLIEKFNPLFEQAKEWEEKAKQLIVTDASQVRIMGMARQARLALKGIRVSADNTRKTLKEDSNRYGKAVQGVYNVFEYLIVPIEKYLDEQEHFVEIQEEKRKLIRLEERKEELIPLSEYIPAGLDFLNMADEDYKNLVDNATLLIKAKADDALKSEQERIEREKKEVEERERFRLENEILKAEAEARERRIVEERKIAEESAAKERAEQERLLAEERKKAKAEAEAREKVEAELRAKKQEEDKRLKEKFAAETARLKAQKEAERKAKNAPDKEKIVALIQSLESIELPAVRSDEAKQIMDTVKSDIGIVINYLTKSLNNL